MAYSQHELKRTLDWETGIPDVAVYSSNNVVQKGDDKDTTTSKESNTLDVGVNNSGKAKEPTTATKNNPPVFSTPSNVEEDDNAGIPTKDFRFKAGKKDEENYKEELARERLLKGALEKKTEDLSLNELKSVILHMEREFKKDLPTYYFEGGQAFKSDVVKKLIPRMAELDEDSERVYSTKKGEPESGGDKQGNFFSDMDLSDWVGLLNGAISSPMALAMSAGKVIGKFGSKKTPAHQALIDMQVALGEPSSKKEKTSDKDITDARIGVCIAKEGFIWNEEIEECQTEEQYLIYLENVNEQNNNTEEEMAGYN